MKSLLLNRRRVYCCLQSKNICKEPDVVCLKRKKKSYAWTDELYKQITVLLIPLYIIDICLILHF